MSMNHIQFQPGLSMPEFIQQYGTEAQCEEALVKIRWPQGFYCPKCGYGGHCALHGKKWLTFQCNACHQQTSLIADTLFQGTNLPLTTWFLAIYFISQAKTGLSALALKRHLGVSYPNAAQIDARPFLKISLNISINCSFSSSPLSWVNMQVEN